MGARLSQPRGPSGEESSAPTRVASAPTPKRPWGGRPINSRTIIAPAAAATMAVLLFVYARTSIRAAKANAQRHREADSGGEGLSLLQEHRRRHGLIDRIGNDGQGTVVELGKEIFGKDKKDKQDVASGGSGRTEDEERLRAALGKKG